MVQPEPEPARSPEPRQNVVLPARLRAVPLHSLPAIGISLAVFQLDAKNRVHRNGTPGAIRGRKARYPRRRPSCRRKT